MTAAECTAANRLAAVRLRSARACREASTLRGRTWSVYVRSQAGRWVWFGWVAAPGARSGQGWRWIAPTFPAAAGHVGLASTALGPVVGSLQTALRSAAIALAADLALVPSADLAAIEDDAEGGDALHVDGRGWPVDATGDLAPQ